MVVLGAGILAACIYLGVRHTSGKWTGVDENVVEKVAKEAGHPATRPLIDTDQGDLLLFVFLLAGAAGGFLLGYNFRALFGREPGRRGAENAEKQQRESK